MQNRFYKIGIGVIFSLIIAGFLLPGVADLFIRQTNSQKYIAKIDGESINEPHFFRLLGLSIQRLQMFYPKLTFQDLIQMNYPTDMLRDFVRRQIMRKHMVEEGFIVNEKAAIDMIKKQLSGQLPESRSERRMLVEDVKAAAILDQLILPYNFTADYIKALIQALSIKRSFNIIEIPYDKMAVKEPFTQEVQKAFQKTAEKKYRATLMNPKRKDFAIIDIDPTKLSATPDEVSQYFEANKAKYQKDSKTEVKLADITKQVEAHVRQEKIRTVVADVKAQLDQEKSTPQQLAQQHGFNITTYEGVDGVGSNKAGENITLPAREKTLEALLRLEEEEHMVIGDEQQEGRLYAVKVTKVHPEQMKTGVDLTAALKDLWSKERQREIAHKLALEILDDKQGLSSQIKRNNLSTHKDLSIATSTNPAQYPHKGLTPEMVDRLMTANKEDLHMEYGKNSIMLFEVLKDTADKMDDKIFEKQKKAFEEMAADAAQQAWFGSALIHHKVEINISALHQRLG